MIDFPQENKNSQLSMIVGMMREARKNLKRSIEELTVQQLDYTPDDKSVETIGTLLYHIAGVEWSWIFEDIDGKEMEFEKWKYAFALRKGSGLDHQISGNSLQYYLDLLDEVRSEVLERLTKFTDQDLSNEIDSDGGPYSLRWILYHVLEHEIFHLGQIRYIIRSIKKQNI